MRTAADRRPRRRRPPPRTTVTVAVMSVPHITSQRLGGDGRVVRLRPMRVARARTGLGGRARASTERTRSFEVRIRRDPQRRGPGLGALAMKRRGFEHPAKVGRPGRRSGAAPIPRRRHRAGERVA